MADADDPRLNCGFKSRADGELQRIRWDEVDAALSEPDGFVWLDLDADDEKTRRWIEGQTKLPQEARDMLLGEMEHARLKPAGREGLTGVVHDLRHDVQDNPETLGSVRIYFDQRRVITARRASLQAVEQLQKTVEDEGLETRPLPLLANLLFHVSDAFVGLMQEATEGLDDVEAAILEDAPDGAADLGQIRRLLARLRRHLGSQNLALGSLAARPPSWASAQDATALKDAVMRIESVGRDLELAQDRARQLQDERTARLAEITNRNLYVMSIVTAIFLPITLVTGVFGMNVGGVPGTENPRGFAVVMAAMVAMALATWALLKWKKIA